MIEIESLPTIIEKENAYSPRMKIKFEKVPHKKYIDLYYCSFLHTLLVFNYSTAKEILASIVESFTKIELIE